jgi:hypothetical protein
VLGMKLRVSKCYSSTATSHRSSPKNADIHWALLLLGFYLTLIF